MPRERKTYWVYIMGSLTGTLYIGMTSKLQARVFEHKFHRVEGFIKGWRRSKKIALIEYDNPHWLDLAREWYPWMKEPGEGRGPSTPQPDSHPRIRLLRSG